MEPRKGSNVNKQVNVLVRLLEVYIKFQTQPYVTIAMIMAQYNIGYKQASRYIRTLEEAGVPIYSERSDYVKMYKLLRKKDVSRN